MNVSTVRIATRVTFRRIARALLNVFTLRNLKVIGVVALAGIGAVLMFTVRAVEEVIEGVGAALTAIVALAIPCGILYVIFHFIIKYW